jgi:hypothetical protein
MNKKLQFENIKELKTFLKKHGIPFKKWISGRTKTVEDLFHDLADGIVSIEILGGRLVRLVSAVAVDVCCLLTDAVVQILQEKEQRFADGGTLTRQTRHTLSTEIFPQELKTDAVKRSIIDTLRIRKDLEFIFLTRVPAELAINAAYRHIRENRKLAKSCLLFAISPYETEDKIGAENSAYPGLPTKRRHFWYLCVIPKPPVAKLGGYRHKHNNKTTRYNWSLLEAKDWARYCLPVVNMD